MHGTRLTFGKPFVRKQITCWYFSIVPAKSVEVSIKLSEDCYCNLSVPIPNEQTIGFHQERSHTCRPLRLQLHGAIYRSDSFVLIVRYCANLKAIRYESISLNRIVADKSHHVIVALRLLFT